MRFLYSRKLRSAVSTKAYIAKYTRKVGANYSHDRTGGRLLYVSNEMSQLLTPHSSVTAPPMLIKLETYTEDLLPR